MCDCMPPANLRAARSRGSVGGAGRAESLARRLSSPIPSPGLQVAAKTMVEGGGIDGAMEGRDGRTGKGETN